MIEGKKKRVLTLFMILGIFFLNIALVNLNMFEKPYNGNESYNKSDTYDKNVKQKDNVNKQGTYEEYFTKEWLDNPGFTTVITPWYSTSSGDDTDVNASYSSEAANYEILGDKRTFTFAEDPPLAASWTAKQNPNFPFYPDNYLINGSGCAVEHFWDEGADQSVAVSWDRNFTMPVNMSDYVITSASISAEVNGLVHRQSYQPYSKGIEAGNDLGTNTTQYATGDYVRFYVLISDLNKKNEYEIAYNQTSKLGQDSPRVSSIPDTYMVPITEESLIFYLTSVLSDDYYNFTMTLGMRIWCEDNYPQDSDYWKRLVISSVNLTFSYEKKIDQLTTLSWNQIGNKISGANINILNATLNFKYKVNQAWPSASPNSELRIIINGTQHSESVKLSSATTSYQDAKNGGFDVTTLIKKDVNISLFIQLFIADEFELASKIVISIDNVSLQISYKEIKNEEITTLDLFLNGVNSTLDKYIELNKGVKLNITVKYKNSTGGFIDGANVNIKGDGVSGTQQLEEQVSLKQYNITVDTNNLDFGNNYMTITASKFSYETRIISNFKIKILDIQSNISKILINGEDHTNDKSYDISAGKKMNITISYTDYSGSFITGATVRATGASFNRKLNESLTLEQYNITLNTTSDLGVGVSFVTISAEKENYTYVSEKLTIIVWDQETFLDLYLNGINKTIEKYIQINVNKTLNITVSYKDDLKQHISGAQINLTGPGIDKPLTEIVNNYTTTINTSSLNQGVNFLSIYAYKHGYDPQAIRITVEIIQEQTDLRLFLNGTDKTIDKTEEINIGDHLNITITYDVSSSGAFIDSATVQIIGGYYNGVNLTEIGALKQYTIIINSTDLNWGVNYITIYAYKTNYESQTITFKLTIIDKSTKLDLYLNGTKRITEEEKSITIPWGETLNITSVYKENVSGDFISGATVQLKYGLTVIGILQENTLKNYYNYTLKTSYLSIGIYFLTINANITNYEAQTLIFRVEIINRDTVFGDLLLNNQSTSILTIAWNETVDIIVQYNDTKTGELIYNANIVLKNGTSVFGNFTMHPFLKYYNLTISTTNLVIGYNYFTLICQKDNYTTISKEITIKVNRRETLFEIFLNGENQTIDPSLTIPFGDDLEIKIKYLDKDTGLAIKDAIVQLSGEQISEILNWNNALGYYIINTIDTKEDLIIGPNFLSIEINRINYESISESIKIEIRTLDLEIKTESGESTINAKPGEDVTIRIVIENLDFGGKIDNAYVTYTSNIPKEDIREGELEEVSKGVYELVLTDVPEGTFTITITIFGDEDEGYETHQLELTLVVKRPKEEDLLIRILAAIAICATIGLTIYLIAYQKVLKYPKPVRKVRNYRKSLKKEKVPNIEITTRDIAFSAIYKEKIDWLSKESKEKFLEPKKVEEEIIKKPISKEVPKLKDELKK
ncbi:MAG: hypothetical protein ACTSQJ_11560 [Promethearchaeota archaeon]